MSEVREMRGQERVETGKCSQARMKSTMFACSSPFSGSTALARLMDCNISKYFPTMSTHFNVSISSAMKLTLPRIHGIR